MKKTLLFITVTILLSISFGLHAQVQVWDFGNDSINFPVSAGVPAGTTVTINGLSITAGATPANMGAVEASTKIFGDITYHHRFKFNGAGYTGALNTDVTPTVNMPTQRYVSFDVPGNCTITVLGITGSSAQVRRLFVTDGDILIGSMEMPTGSEITEATLNYTGPAMTLFMFCNASINLYYMKVAPPTVTPFAGEDFESIKMNPMEFGTTGMMTVVPNPDTAKNSTLYCAKFIRPGTTNGGQPWSGFWSTLPVAVDVTVNKYVHVKVWKSRISPIKFKLEGGAAGNLETPSMSPQTKMNEWEDIVFDFSSKTGTYPTIAFMPDFEDPLAQVTDLTMYFDEIYVNNSATPGSAAVQVIEDFETIPINAMLDGANDLSTFTLIPNPDKSGINTSDYVMKFHRDMDGVPWGGFWSSLPGPADVTTNKYIHVKVWKPRISPVKLKLEGGAAGNLEAPSIFPQTKTNEWEDMVFDFTSKTGTYPTLAFMPDFNDPVNLSSDIDIYFDDIIINNIPTAFVSNRENALANKIQMYPNPVSNVLTINSTMDVRKVIITSMVGKVVGDYAFSSSQQTINTSNLSSGIYLVTLVGKDGSKVTQKLIKN